MTNVPSIQFHQKFKPLFLPRRIKAYYGGRGGLKSWSFARALLLIGINRRIRVACTRELQISISDSVHKLLTDQIDKMGLGLYYKITKNRIEGHLGTEFFYKGLKHNPTEIKSLEGVDICWVEEAQNVSKESWDILTPTIRKPGSEIWISFNPGGPDDETYKRYVLNPPPDALVVKVGWQDNPWLPEPLRKEMEHCRATDYDAYLHIWEGFPLIISEAQIFKGKYVVEPFETPPDARFYHGADWGFATDPTTLVRAFIQDDQLFIDQEAYGVGVEIDETPDLFDSIDSAREWPIKADSARPETISYMARRGFDISAAKKWDGSVKDGIAYLRGFRRIVIHPRCRHIADEMRLYSYKVDRITQEVLPVIVDKHNHCIDALRYALDGYITNKGSLNISEEIDDLDW